MILKFPDIDTLTLALTTTILPTKVTLAGAKAAFDEEGRIWVEPSVNPPRKARSELTELGVESPRRSDVPLSEEVGSWLELFPLQRDDAYLSPPEQAPVLFELSDGKLLPELVSEMLRLGNDRQSYRWLTPAGRGSKTRALLRVIGPPYYSLLRALDAEEDGSAPRAFLEHAPRVWTEIGYKHPLSDLIQAPPDQILLLAEPRQWMALEEQPFQDIYEAMELILPKGAVSWKEKEIEKKITVPLRLARSGSQDAAELWVLREDPVEQLNHLVQNSEDPLLNRLSFAVGEKGKDRTIVVRVRPSNQPPPIISSLQGEKFRPWKKLPNLFLPCEWRLHPPLRRDKVRSLLADDPAIITWLYPDGKGGFRCESMSEDAFRPLTDWVDYVIDHEQKAIETWIQATHFDFEMFICDEEDRPKPRKPPEEGLDRDKGSKKKGGKKDSKTEDLSPAFATAVEETEEEVEAEIEELAATVSTKPDELKIRLGELEDQFLKMEHGLDAPERQELWPEMAQLNAQLGNTEDGGICWTNAIWHQERKPLAWIWNWFMTESSAFDVSEEGPGRRKGWTAKTARNPLKPSEVSGMDLDKVLKMSDPNSSDARALAAYVTYAAYAPKPPKAVLDRLNAIGQFFQKRESVLSIRSTWLAWSAIAHLSGDDLLTLARARDRLLERLFESGLRPEQNLPSFLRFSGQPTSQRFRGVRDWLTRLNEEAHKWDAENRYEALTDTSAKATGAYIDLMFAFALARLGEIDASRELGEAARERLKGLKEEAHQFLGDAFVYRINLVRENKPRGGSLSKGLLEFLENKMERMQRYAAERLRQHSRILEPDQKIDPYRFWTANVNELEKELASLADMTDRKKIVGKVEKLWKEQTGRSKQAQETRARILKTALEIAPRVQEDFALEMLSRLSKTYDALPEAKEQPALMQKAELLERGMFVAAHFDRKEHVQTLVARFQALIQDLKGSSNTVQSLDNLAGHCFRGLRKLGMRDEIDVLLREMADLILEGKDPAKIQLKDHPNWHEEMRTLLHVAAGWLHFGRDQQAQPILHAARHLLFQEKNLDARNLTRLARGYASTVGQANIELAQKSLEEILQKLKGVKDTYTTNRFYSLSHLDLIEAIVLAVVNDDYTMGENARRWLDDDEFLIRRRVHSDYRALEEKKPS